MNATPARPPAVLFVCTANICRSPMAEALFKLRLRDVPGGDTWRVESAGTWASDGQRASENSVKVMASRGVDISAHRSRTVTRELLEGFDLILVMEPGHKEALTVEFPQTAGRVFLLSELSGPPLPVADPYGMALERYEKTADEIDRHLANGMPQILKRLARSA